MISFLFAAAAAAVASFSGPIAHIDDYPEKLLREGKTGADRIEVVVAPSGEVLTCRILIPSRFLAFDEAACRAAKRAKANPASDQAGLKVHGVVKKWIAWMTGPIPPALSADTILTVSKMPEGIKDGSITELALVVDESGKIASCDVEKSSGSDALDSAACKEVVHSAHLPAALGQDGTPVRSVQGLNVQFKSKPVT